MQNFDTFGKKNFVTLIFSTFRIEKEAIAVHWKILFIATFKR